MIEVQGVGEVTVLALLTQLPELGKLSNKEIVALVGRRLTAKIVAKTQSKWNPDFAKIALS
ncbi:MAG: hypothetical protein PHC94_10955 [Methylobacter sp.]|nr:hypothetical protein [Methylobacter sp.]